MAGQAYTADDKLAFARKDLTIVRQSSLDRAVTLVTANSAGTRLTEEQQLPRIIAIADMFVRYVLSDSSNSEVEIDAVGAKYVGPIFPGLGVNLLAGTSAGATMSPKAVEQQAMFEPKSSAGKTSSSPIDCAKDAPTPPEESAPQEGATAEKPRGRGRPAGSKNKAGDDKKQSVEIPAGGGTTASKSKHPAPTAENMVVLAALAKELKALAPEGTIIDLDMVMTWVFNTYKKYPASIGSVAKILPSVDIAQVTRKVPVDTEGF
jgi:hypothetical protein